MAILIEIHYEHPRMLHYTCILLNMTSTNTTLLETNSTVPKVVARKLGHQTIDKTNLDINYGIKLDYKEGQLTVQLAISIIPIIQGCTVHLAQCSEQSTVLATIPSL